jgi:hypothetical protein
METQSFSPEEKYAARDTKKRKSRQNGNKMETKWYKLNCIL